MSISLRHAPIFIALMLAGWLRQQPIGTTVSRTTSEGLSYKPHDLHIPPQIRQYLNTISLRISQVQLTVPKAAPTIHLVAEKLQIVKPTPLLVRRFIVQPPVPHFNRRYLPTWLNKFGGIHTPKFDRIKITISNIRNTSVFALRRLWSFPKPSFIARIVIIGILMTAAFGLSVWSVLRPPRILHTTVSPPPEQYFSWQEIESINVPGKRLLYDTSYITNTGSMSPLLSSNAKPLFVQTDNVSVGDVIIFQISYPNYPDNSFICHRIV